MNNIKIDFNKPVLAGKEFEYIAAAFQKSQISGDGYYTKKCQGFLEQALQTRKVLLTTNCSHALEMAAILLDIKPGDEVILPSFTFVSTVNAFVLRGAVPIFADVCPDTLNINEEQLEGLISSRTRAIVVVHYAGVGCEMDSIMKVADKHHIPIIEDNAHGLFGKYKGKLLGSFGCMATQSFHETKNITCGEGGALVINDAALVERAEIIREKGTNRSRFFRGQVDKYTWVDIGSSYLPSDILAAVLWAQLENCSVIQEKRKDIWNYYNNNLHSWAKLNGIQLPFIPSDCEQAYHMFYMVFPSLETRQAMIQHLRGNGIVAVFHYQPLHLSDMGKKFGGKTGDCPVTEKLGNCLLRLPFYNNLSHEELNQVVETIKSFNF